ncbi:hypothetical protein GCM10008905_08230 [Clostridium malenominatum]|uniref:Uncharacterized protein n=1 Tax=Clostridium malenominatum TaxID=1539 RepID=A0ABP3U0S4_9CLOT
MGNDVIFNKIEVVERCIKRINEVKDVEAHKRLLINYVTNSLTSS